MNTITYTKVPGSDKAAHQYVQIGDQRVGEVWREQAHVVVSKLTAPRRTAFKWRWFARKDGDSAVLGKGTRVALLLGAGFGSREGACEALQSACRTPSPEIETTAAPEAERRAPKIR